MRVKKPYVDVMLQNALSCGGVYFKLRRASKTSLRMSQEQEHAIQAFRNCVISVVVALLHGRSMRAVDLCPGRCGGGEGAANDAEKFLVVND
jgi:hypothetical protein